MQIYRVGGCVRDKLLGLTVKDHDWVVVGATPEQMLAANYQQVGADFPVFLHPETHEEYALARTERKSGAGYQGFTVHATPDVTLEEDLIRRDLTINAMAQTLTGDIIDPFDGQTDLRRKILRHVSPAFIEDPVRVLRIARFSARFSPLGFHISPETIALIKTMVSNGEVDALVAERVWQEVNRALTETKPSEFFEVLRRCGALAKIFPEIDNLYGIPQRADYHPEVDTGIHTMMVLDQAVSLSQDGATCFAALTHDLGKATTPPEEWPSHKGHETRSVDLIKTLCHRLRVPKNYRELAIITAQFHTHCHRASELRANTLVSTLESLDAIRRPERFEQFLTACEADSRGRLGFENHPYPQADIFRRAFQTIKKVDIQSLVAKGLTGTALRDQIHRERIRAVSAIHL